MKVEINRRPSILKIAIPVRQLTGPELSSLAEKMVHASDPAEAALMRDAIVRGFYGAQGST